MLAPPLVAWAILQYNWQAAFVMTGALGLVWVAVWLWLYHPPEKHPALTLPEFDYIAAGQEKHLRDDGTRPAVLSLLRRRNFWASRCHVFWPTRPGGR
jgi:ACS family hexuronate transporter-like MFS transporter